MCSNIRAAREDAAIWLNPVETDEGDESLLLSTKVPAASTEITCSTKKGTLEGSHSC
jgi:hypothetical protein